MIIGIPKEIMHGENRVACSPETVGKFVKDGYTVLVENHAGDGALYHDEEYAAAGAKMMSKAEDIYAQAELILKVKEPLFNEQLGKHEVELMHKGQYLITFIHPASPVNHEMVKKLTAQGVTAFTLDCIPRISRAQNMDALTSMSTCAGYKGIIMAADHMTSFIPQMFTAVGKIEQAYNSSDGLSYKLKVRLSTDFGNLRDVVVLSDKSIAERAALMQAARDSISFKQRQ